MTTVYEILRVKRRLESHGAKVTLNPYWQRRVKAHREKLARGKVVKSRK